MKNISILPFTNKPGRYLGHEYNSVYKSWDQMSLHWALIFPDLYEIGMSHQGLQILYHIINGQDDISAERCFCPDIDAEKKILEYGGHLSSLESGHALQDFDILGITLPYELCYSNILTILHLSGIPFWATERDEKYPLVVGGGSCSLNPEPVSDFFDVILLGDGEEAVLEISEEVRKAKQAGLARAALLRKLSAVRGVYIPSFFQPRYDNSGRILEVVPLEADRPVVHRRILADLNKTDHLKRPLVPNAKIVHDRLGLEIARGCTRGCRFCQAGITYRPVRERSCQEVLELAKEGIAASGFEELALLSLSTGDYSCLEQLLPQLMDRFATGFVSVSMPSMRVGTLTPAVMDQIKRVRKTGFTVAPEAGSERLRSFINKGITEEDLLSTCREAFTLGWNLMKLYFMIGLPTETWEDVEAIADLARKTLQQGNGQGRGRRQINVSVGTFVPKPHTPFQWEQQLTVAESRERINRLKEILPRRGCKLKWHDPEQSFLEGVFSRGDRRLAKLLQEAWKKGARLDGWSDHFHLATWLQAADSCRLDLNDYLRKREFSEILPWQHLHSGVDNAFLRDELDKAHNLLYTPDCRYHGCQKCGVCDFRSIKPLVEKKELNQSQPSPSSRDLKTSTGGDDRHFKYLVVYERTGDICFLGHLEFLQIIFRTLRRAGIQTHFSQGFNPSPKVSFGPALPVGTESLAEYFIMDLPEPLPAMDETIALLNSKLPQGIRVKDISLHSGRIFQDVITTYWIILPQSLTEKQQNNLSAFHAAGHFPVTRIRKGKTKEIDIRPLISDIKAVDDTTLIVKIVSKAGTPGIKASEALQHILMLEEKELLTAHIQKTNWTPLTEK
jgi:radical SAM family uncharacterized protein/radical SAM-linked protein